MKKVKLLCALLILLSLLTGCALPAKETAPPTGDTAVTQYIGNTKFKKFHVPGCASLPSEQNRTTFDSYDDAVQAGYSPCGNCMG